MTTTPDPDPAAAHDTGDAAQAAEQRLHPLSWLFVLLSQVRQFLLPLLAVLVFGARGEARWHLLAGAVAITALVAASIWRYLTYRYRIGTDSLFVRSGLFERSLRQIPFSRIHDVGLHQTLLHRLCGVAEVRLESAGGDRTEARMQVLRYAEALALERVIRRRSQDHDVPAQGAATAADTNPAHTQTLLALSTGEVIRLGLISNRGMVVVAGAFALAWQIIPEGLSDGAFRSAARELFGYAGGLSGGWIGMSLAAATLIALVLALVRALSVLLALVQYHGFRLDEHDGRRLTVERGLFTRRRNSVPRRRIQAWTLTEGVLHRLFGRRSLGVDTAVVAQGNQDTGLSELAPVATPARCDALVQHLLPGAAWPPAHWQPLHRLAWLRLSMGGVVFALILAAALSWRYGAWGLLGLGWIVWSVFVARQHADRAGYVLDGDLLAVREGWWSRHWRFTDVGKLQAVQWRQSPLDRRMGMASLWLDTAGANALGPGLRIRYLPQAQARALLDRVAAETARRPLRW